MTRREEAYHDTLRDTAPAGNGGAPAATLAGRELVYDVYRRGACIDHAPRSARPHRDFDRATLPELAAPGRRTGHGASRTDRSARAPDTFGVPGGAVLCVDSACVSMGRRSKRATIYGSRGRHPGGFSVRHRNGGQSARWPGRRPLLKCRTQARTGALGEPWCDLGDLRVPRRRCGTRPARRLRNQCADGSLACAPRPCRCPSAASNGRLGSAPLFVSRVSLTPERRWTRVLRQSVELR